MDFNNVLMKDAYGYDMKEALAQLLSDTPGLKAKLIARELSKPRPEVNAFLHDNRDVFHQDDDYGWHLVDTSSLLIQLPEGAWINGEAFEKSLNESGFAFNLGITSVRLVCPSSTKILLDAIAKMLALANQLQVMGIRVTIDLSDAHNVHSYLDRVGFMSHLASEVTVIPDRPEVSAADIFRDNSQTVVEFGAISPKSPDTTIPKRLSARFVEHAGNKYKQASFTVFSELFGNVCEHSETLIPGFAALQKYGGKAPHVQIVVSDSGNGIVGTLIPALEQHYPNLLQRLTLTSSEGRAYLLKEVLEKGSISQTGDTGRGLGLKRSREYAEMYNADVSIRQEDFELKMSYRDGKLVTYRIITDVLPLRGTHVCFDFILDNTD